MSNYENLDIIMDQGSELIGFYRDNPCIAAWDLLKVDLAPIQQLIFEDMWFKDNTIAVCSRGFGKSVFVDSISSLRNKGLVYLSEVLPQVPYYLKDGEEEIINWNDEVYTSEGFRKTKKLCIEKGIEGKLIKTQNGFENRGSKHHPLLTINDNCDLVYKSMDEFKSGDRICIQRKQNVFGDNEINGIDAYLIGLFIGDGMMSDEYYHQSITTNDEEIINFCKQYCENTNTLYRLDKDKRTKSTYSIIFKKFGWFFDKYNINRVLSYYKSVPYSIRTSTKESQIAFLQGYFDADGTVGKSSGGVSCCSVSKKLLNEIQLMLLNFGIVSRLRKKKTKSKFGKAYLLDMFSEDALKFKELIGFSLKRKQGVLDEYFGCKILNPNKDTIPYIRELCRGIQLDYRKVNSNRYNDPNTPRLNIEYWNCKDFTYRRLNEFIEDVETLLFNGYKISNKSIIKLNKLKTLSKYNYFFDTIKSIEDWKGDCYDFEMDMGEEPNYFANGFINHNTFLLGVLASLSCILKPGYRVGLIGSVFRQSKMIFSEVEKLYNKSPILRDACEKRPTRGSDTCYLKFKSVGGYNGSFIEALPLGNDGSKIRGSRFYLICIDELAQVPNKIIDMVIRPFAATTLEPMEKVRRIAHQNKLIEQGLATPDDFEDETVNKMVMTSSGYYKFNHMWRRMKDHWGQMDAAALKGEESRYAVWQIPYWDLPDGFLDSDNIEESRRIMSRNEFKMEYEAEMISDSDGFFKASLLESCSVDSGVSIEAVGDSSGRYILGIDPNQGGVGANCGAVVIRLGEVNKVVNVIELRKNTTQQLTMAVQSICEKYNIERIYMDKGGGGKAVMDLLDEGYNDKVPIIDVTDKDKLNKKGKRILEMVNFTPSWISDANFDTLALLEDKKLLFPEPPTSVVDLEGKIYEKIETLKKQMLNIIVTQTSSGMLHFDTPKKGQVKDLYSALILAGYGIRAIERLNDEDISVLHGDGGLVRRRGANNWNNVDGNNRHGLNIGSAVLTKKK